MNLNKIIKNYLITYYRELESAAGGMDSLLDVGCGANSPINYFKNKINYTLGVDGFKPSIRKSKQNNIHNEYRCMDLLDIDKVFKENEFDCVLASDVIEHFDKNTGNQLLIKMEKIARYKVIVFTPNGFLIQAEHSNNPLQKHHSGWTVSEMEELGYKVIGINGWKPILGEMSLPRFRPKNLWKVISRLSQPFVRNHPHYAFQLLCIKEL